MSVANVSSSTTSKVSSYDERPTRSLSNRFSSFLSPKSSHTNNFSIELNDPIKTYGPGDAVKGKVVLDISRPLGVTHVVVSLHGYVQVFKNHAKSKSAHRNTGSRAATGRGKRWVSEYYGDGYMSLFEEEIVLCGEGRLDPNYSPFHFHFNLEFPSELALPSSINFERGTIAYEVTATLTRPAYTAPTMICNSRVVFLEDIDVAMLPSSKPQRATLHPEYHSGSPRSSLKRLASYDVKRNRRTSINSTTIQPSKSTFESSQSNAEITSVREACGSVASTRSSSSGPNRISAAPSEPRSSHTSPSLNGEAHPMVRHITASAELCRSGSLPGQLVPLLIKITHNKVVHNPAGILVTLYRQARVDMHPHLPLASSEKGTNARYEDYYPRSRTGLGGLSLSAAGSSQVWRKDLSQTTAPLYVDPRTMSQEIKVGIRVPELPGAFPSIRNVPGQMVSFRYVIEVIIDIHGKLIGRDWVHSGTNPAADVQQNFSLNGQVVSGDAGDRTQTMSYESRCIDTTQLRRDKHAVTVECELIVGTRDSQKSRGKQKVSRPDFEANPGFNDSLDRVTAFSGSHETMQQDHIFKIQHHTHTDEDYDWVPRWDEYGQRWLYINQWGHIYDEDWRFLGYDYGSEVEQEQRLYDDVSTSVPLPYFAEEQDVSEKERLRRAEASLLPSQPPVAEQSSASVTDYGPSAPCLTGERPMHSPQAVSCEPPLQTSSSTVQDFASNAVPHSVSPLVPSYGGEGSSAEGLAESPVLQSGTDDKQELERQRLQAQVSEPEAAAAESTILLAPSAPPSIPEEDSAPTAPAPLEDDGSGAGVHGPKVEHDEDLPQYER